MTDTVAPDTDTPAPAPAGFDAAALVDGLTLPQLLALQDAAETRLQHSAADLARHGDNDLLNLLETREATGHRRETFNAALYIEISDRSAYRLAGHNTHHALYAFGLRLGRGEAQRRRIVAENAGRLTALTGEKLPAKLPTAATALADGTIGREHLTTICDTLAKIPASAAAEHSATAEAMLVDAAAHLDPAALATVGNRILAHLDPDGTLTDDRDRQRQRCLALQAQNRQLMSKLRAQLTPLLRASLETLWTHWAALGMNNPADPDSPHGAANQPGLDPTVLAAAAERDDRTLTQRQHDALLALLTWANTQTAGVSNGSITSQIVVTTTDEDLARQTGIAWTTTGTRLPITDLVALAADTVPYLAVFAGATSQVLYLGRASRFASRAQRLALFARDRGCTTPGCTVPFARTQAHHMPDWARGANTDIDHLGAACGKHNRTNGTEPGQWESTVLTTGPDAGRVAWRPAGQDGPWRTNPLFHPDKLAHAPTPPPGLPIRLTHHNPPPPEPPPEPFAS